MTVITGAGANDAPQERGGVTEKKRPPLSFWQIWNMCFGFLGIQFGFALQNANVSRIFQTLGAEVDEIPILWIAAPLTGLLVQPIVGYLSDHTWNRFGRRRPYFTIGAIFATLSLFVMPNSPYLWIAAGMLWIMDRRLRDAELFHRCRRRRGVRVALYHDQLVRRRQHGAARADPGCREMVVLPRRRRVFRRGHVDGLVD